MANPTSMYSRKKHWDGMGVELGNATSVKEAFVKAGLDFIVEKQAVTWAVQCGPKTMGAASVRHFPLDGKPHTYKYWKERGSEPEIRVFQEEAQYKTYRTDTNQILSGTNSLTEIYTVIQNHELLPFVDVLLEHGAIVETAGCIKNGARVWMLLKLNESKVLGDAFENYLLLTNGHDGRNAFNICITLVRVACLNSLIAALREAEVRISMKHVPGIAQRQEDAFDVMKKSAVYLNHYNQMAEKMACEKFSPSFLSQFVDKLLPVRERPTTLISENAYTEREKIRQSKFMEIYNREDNQNFLGTFYGLFNAMGDYYSHEHENPLRHTTTLQENNFMKLADGNHQGWNRGISILRENSLAAAQFFAPVSVHRKKAS